MAEYCGCIAEIEENNIEMPNVRKIMVEDGVGVSGWVEAEEYNWKHVIIGNERVLKKNGGRVRVSLRQEMLMNDFMNISEGKVVLIVAVDDELEIMISLSDEIRVESIDFIDNIRNMNMDITMLTGDQDNVAVDICNQIGIERENCKSRLLPSQKLEWILKKQKEELPSGTGFFNFSFFGFFSPSKNSKQLKTSNLADPEPRDRSDSRFDSFRARSKSSNNQSSIL